MSPTDERANLHRTIWRVANDLRGSVDGWDFKAYVLGMLFYRFISEHIIAFVKQVQAEAGSHDFDYSQLPDAEAEAQSKYLVNTLGFFIRPSDLFSNVREHAPHDQNLNETLARVFQNIEASAVGTSSEDDMKGLFADIDTNSAKLGNTIAQRNEKLTKLLDAIGDLELGDYRDTNIDTFGDAYEYLMTMYASSAGKSGGEFFTPPVRRRADCPHHGVGQGSCESGLRPGLRFGFVAVEVRENPGSGECRRGLLRSRNQPHHL